MIHFPDSIPLIASETRLLEVLSSAVIPKSHRSKSAIQPATPVIHVVQGCLLEEPQQGSTCWQIGQYLVAKKGSICPTARQFFIPSLEEI
jgi:hypothetical protein